MTSISSVSRRIAVVAGGISGLAAAHRLIERDGGLEVSLLEAGNRLGGVIQSQRRQGFLLERSADMFTTNEPWAIQLCQRIGFADQLIGTNTELRRAHVVHKGRLCPIPAGFTLMSPAQLLPILTTRLLTWKGKARLVGEYFVPPRKQMNDESLAQFATRRFGKEAYERLIQPLIGGIYTADPRQLSMAATMKQFVAMERESGSLIRGMRNRRRSKPQQDRSSGARYGLFVTPRDGLSSLVEALARRLPDDCIRLNSPVENVNRGSDGKWVLTVGGASPAEESFDAVILATPASVSARLLRTADSDLAEQLQSIPYASAAIVLLGYPRGQVQRPLDGFGFVVPLAEGRRILACSFPSIKFAGRAPDDHVLMRVFVGGACQPELLELADGEIQQLAREELAELIGLRGEPVLSDVVRWRQAMPQYHVGHLERVARIEERIAGLRGLELAGNAYGGVGIPFCIRSGEQAAERLLETFSEQAC